jgi:hypothetical protein
MTTSKSGLANLPVSYFGQSSEEQTKIEDLQRIQKELRDALQNRQQLFDPVLLAMAQGFLAPTRTGSFGESLANVAEKVGPAQAAAEKQRLERLGMERELAAADLAMTQQAEMDKRFLPKILGTPTAKPAEPGKPAEPAAEPAVQVGTPLAPRPEPKAEVTPPSAQKSGINNLTDEDLVAMSRNPRYEKMVGTILKLRDDIAFNDGVLVRKSTGEKIADFRIEKPDVFPTHLGDMRMTPKQFERYQKEFEDKGKDAANAFLSNLGLRTVAQQTAEAKGTETAAQETAKAEVGRTQQAIEQGDVTGRMAQYRLLQTIASGKDANQIFGIVNRPTIGAAITRLVNEGIRADSKTIQAGALIDALRNVGLEQETINKYELALNTMANIQLQMAKIAQGQGSVSNFERELFALAAISPQDNPATILRKVQLLQARAEFDRDLGRVIRKSKKSLDAFKDENEDQYNSMVQSYLDRVSQIAQSVNIPVPKPGSPRQPGAAPTTAGQDIRRRIGITTP